MPAYVTVSSLPASKAAVCQQGAFAPATRCNCVIISINHHITIKSQRRSLHAPAYDTASSFTAINASLCEPGALTLSALNSCEARA